MKKTSNWKEKVSQSKHLKEYYKKNPNFKHPVFGKGLRVYPCQECGEKALFLSFKNRELEWAYCRKCYAKRH